MLYEIYHVVDNHIHLVPRNDDRIIIAREKVGTIEADSVEDAFIKTQNFDTNWNTNKPCRSTSVGDIIKCNNDMYQVLGVGFEKL